MMKRFTILAVVILLITSLAISSGAQHHSDTRERKMQNMSRAEEKNCFGTFSAEDGTVEGRFVSFDHDDENGTISDFEIYTGESYVKVFDRVMIQDFNHIETNISGAVFTMNGSDSRIMIHNNPRTIMQVNNPYTDTPFMIDYEVSDEIDIEETGETRPYSIKYRLSDDRFEGVINTPLNTTLDNDTITVDGENHSETAHSLFMNKPTYTGEESARQEQLRNGIAEEIIGAEIDIIGRGAAHVSHQVRYRENVHLQIISMEQERLRIRVQSEDPQGTSLMIRIEKDSLELEADQIRLELDGEEGERGSLQEVLEAEDDLRYEVQERDDGILEIVVNVPSFSEREIVIEGETRLPGFTLPILLLVFAVTTIVWSFKKNRKD